MQWVANTLHTTSEHGVSSITTADAAHLCCQQSTELTPTDRFKWSRPSRAKDEMWFLRVCHHISNAVYLEPQNNECHLFIYYLNLSMSLPLSSNSQLVLRNYKPILDALFSNFLLKIRPYFKS